MAATVIVLQSILSLHCICVIQVLDNLGALEHCCARVGILNVGHLQNNTIRENIAIGDPKCHGT